LPSFSKAGNPTSAAEVLSGRLDTGKPLPAGRRRSW